MSERTVSTGVVGAVLLGGSSRRFGRDKATAPHPSGGTLAGRLADVLRRGGADPVVGVGGRAVDHPTFPVIPDLRPGEGPLAALATVLRWAPSGHVVVVPTDLVALSPPTVARLLAARRPGCAVVAAVGDVVRVELGVWPVEWRLAVHRRVVAGGRRWADVLKAGPVETVQVDEADLVDADTPEALAGWWSQVAPVTEIPREPPTVG